LRIKELHEFEPFRDFLMENENYKSVTENG